jgi:hypothetical protein
MGEAWQLINLDKRQTLGRWGKLKSHICNCSPAAVVPYLTVPAAPLDSEFIRNAERVGSWAGDRIICVGYSIRPGDYPNGVLTEEELEVAKEKDLYTIAREDFDSIPWISPIFLESQSEALAHDKVWVLRNLSKHQFVRVNAFNTAPENIHGPMVAERRRSLGEVLLSQVMWSTKGETGLKRSVSGLTRGVWAGDRFDIQTFDTIQDDVAWEDVSDNLAQRVREIWRICHDGFPEREWNFD